jgi:ATP-binding cassette subfamily G (WHITE) protein 2 (SNQ2)
MWKDLSIRGIGGTDDFIYQPDLGNILAPWKAIKANRHRARLAAERSEHEGGITSGPDCMAWVQGMSKPSKAEPGLRPGQRYILKDFNGMLHPGEMMLVVGRPGSGCSTLLKGLAGLTGAYAGEDGVVQYGSMASTAKDFKPYKSLVCFNSEEDVHDPNLTVGRTMDFATRNELVAEHARPLGPHGAVLSDDEYRVKTKDDLLKAFQIGHTHDTKVGDQYVRGVSGEMFKDRADRRW